MADRADKTDPSLKARDCEIMARTISCHVPARGKGSKCLFQRMLQRIFFHKGKLRSHADRHHFDETHVHVMVFRQFRHL